MSERTPPSAKDVAQRVLALLALVDKASGFLEADAELDAWISEWVSDHRIHEYFSPAETAFFAQRSPAMQDIASATWRAEALAPMFWALGMLEELPPLNQALSWEKVRGLQDAFDDPETFIRNANLRAEEAIVEAEDFLYRQHWQVRDAQLFHKPMPAELNPEIVYERRYGASWLTGRGEDWDHVPTDT